VATTVAGSATAGDPLLMLWESMPRAVIRSVARVSAFVLVGLVALLFADSLLHLTPGFINARAHKIGYVAGTVAAACLIATRAALVRKDRAPWLLIALGLGLFGCGDLYYVTVITPDPTPPYPNLGDLM
jgi:hypothetical protein